MAIEKPFGSDLESARHLNELLRTRMPHPTVFRIDHFLSDDLVRQVIALRFGNRVFEPTWNATQVERVDISWMESLALEGRASYYDRAGALKDMVQNHLMEALALVLMAEPARFDANSIRDMRVEALRTVATPSVEWIRGNTVRARYAKRQDRLPQGPLLRGRAGRRSRAQHRDLRLRYARGGERPVGGRALHPALRQGHGGGPRRDRGALPAAPPADHASTIPESRRTSSGWG